MNRWTRSSRPPGTLFLRIARLLFAEQTVSCVFLPALADFHAELREASGSRVMRAVARCRWYWALTVLLAVTPFSASIPSIADRAPLTRPTNGGWFFMLLYASLFAGAWLCVQEFMAAAVVAGAVLACAMRAWNDHHPAVFAIPTPAGTLPVLQINLAAIPVSGDVAGLIFAAGAILILVVGLPGFWWFFVASALGSLLVAWARMTKKSSAPPPLIANSISAR